MISHSRRRVTVVPSGWDDTRTGPVLVALEGASRGSFAHALDEAAAREVSLVVVHVGRSATQDGGWDEASRRVRIWSTVHPEVEVVVLDVPGDVAATIAGLSVDAGLVVVGHRRRPWLPWFLDRSTALRLLRGLAVPMTVVPT